MNLKFWKQKFTCYKTLFSLLCSSLNKEKMNWFEAEALTSEMDGDFSNFFMIFMRLEYGYVKATLQNPTLQRKYFIFILIHHSFFLQIMISFFQIQLFNFITSTLTSWFRLLVFEFSISTSRFCRLAFDFSILTSRFRLLE